MTTDLGLPQLLLDAADERRAAFHDQEKDLSAQVREYYRLLFLAFRGQVERTFLQQGAQDITPSGDPVWDSVRAFGRGYVDDLVTNFDEMILAAAEPVEEMFDEELAEGYEEGHDRALWLLALNGIEVEAGEIPDRTALKNALILAGVFGIGYPARLQAWHNDIRSRFAQQVRASVLQGASLADTLDTVAALGNTYVGRVEGLGLNELHRAWTVGGFQATQPYRDQLVGEVWLTRRDGLVCPICRAKELTVTDAQPIQDSHPGCVVGETNVSGATVRGGVTKRLYEGLIVTVQTTLGNEITVTPNHPILTPYGWKVAGALREGDQVVGCSTRQRVVSPIDHDNENVPTPISEVFETTLRASGVAPEKVKVAPEDFHGDGTNGQIAEIATNSLMPQALQAATLHHLLQHTLGWGRRASSVLLKGQGVRAPLRFRRNPTTGSIMGGDNLVGPLRHRHASPLDLLLLRLRTQWNAGFQQVPFDGIPAYRSVLLDAQQRFAGQVHTDQVARVDRKTAVCHVYNLDTEGGYYTANGVIVANCRCWKVPIALDARGQPVDWADFLRQIGRR